MKEIYLKNKNLDELVLEPGTKYVFEDGEYSLSKTIFVDVPCEFEGHNAWIKGNHDHYGFLVRSSDVTIKDLKFANVIAAVEVDGWGKEIENILIENLYVDLLLTGIQVGSSRSNSTIRNVAIKNCFINLEGVSLWEQDELAGRLPLEIGACCGRQDSPELVTNCLLENLLVEGNTTKGANRGAFNLILAAETEMKMLQFNVKYGVNKIKNVIVKGNNFDLCWDSPINVTCALANNELSTIENIEICENTARFGIAGIYFFCGEPLIGTSLNHTIKGVKIHHNHLIRGVEDVGEPTRGIFMGAARVDYYPGTIINDCLIEDVEIYGNTIEGAGIVVAGCYNLPDLDATCNRNCINNISIHDNFIKNADTAFTFDGLSIEGRLYDWNFGYPRHDKKWGEEITDDTVETYHCEDNQIKNLICENNTIEGYRYRVKATGADLRGHGVAKNNKVSENIIFKNNKFGVGENHIHVADVVKEDFAHDAGGNKVSQEFFKK